MYFDILSLLSVINVCYLTVLESHHGTCFHHRNSHGLSPWALRLHFKNMVGHSSSFLSYHGYPYPLSKVCKFCQYIYFLMLLGIPCFCKKKPHICFYSFIRKVATARADVDIFNNTLAVCFLASGPWPVNPRKSNEMQKERKKWNSLKIDIPP